MRNTIFNIDPAEQRATLLTFAKWAILGGMVGVLAGIASAVFLITLKWATDTRLAQPALLFLLPFGGLLLGWLYHHFAGAAARGNNLVIEEVHVNQIPIPLRMAPMVLLGTVFTHLFGGSAGREGTAIQMGASLADWLQRRLKLSPQDRRLMLLAGISGGFGSVFGTPLAGFIFALEVQSIGRVWYEGFIPCLTAAIVGDLVTDLLIKTVGVTHSHYPQLVNAAPEPDLLIKFIIAGALFGLTSLFFVELTHGIKQLARERISWSPLRPLVGGLIIIGLTLIVGSGDYLGLSLSLINNSLNGSGVAPFAFLAKLIFTAVTLGMGFMGGEVTPLFVIGSTLGYTLGRVLGVDPALMASVGLVAVFAGASNTPLACTLMGIELFGGGSLLYVGLGCFVAYLASGHRSIYVTQRISVSKVYGLDVRADESLEAIHVRRRESREKVLISSSSATPEGVEVSHEGN